MSKRNTRNKRSNNRCKLSGLISVFLLIWSLPLKANGTITGAIQPQLSEDGEQIVFSNQGAIWTIPRAGGEMIRLTQEPGFDIEPQWSPDGKWIAFIRSTDFSGGSVEFISTEGKRKMLDRKVMARDRLFFDTSGQRLLGLFGDRLANISLRWLKIETAELGPDLGSFGRQTRYALSQDGERIVMAESRDILGKEQAGNFGPQFKVWSMSSKGENKTQLFEFPARIYDIGWADKDTALYVVTDAGGAHHDIWHIPLKDPQHGARKITFGQADEDRPTLSKDGRWMLFTDNRTGPTQLKIRDLSSGLDQSVISQARDFGPPTGSLKLSVRDKGTGHPVTARVSVLRTGGKYHAPSSKLYRLQGRHLHYYAEEASTLTLPEGNYQITAWRGPEYQVLRKEVVISRNKITEVTLSIQRWTNQGSLGWYSGESHIHANYGYGHWYNSPRTMLAQCAGEDLLVCNLMVANSDGDGVFDRQYFRGEADPLSTDDTRLHWNEEFRSTIWGHMTLLNLEHLIEPFFTGFAHTTHPHDHPTNADVAKLVHDQSGHVNYTHPAHNIKDLYLSAYSAKALPIDVALGTVDSIDVMGSNHEANMKLWYGLLNCGFKIPASAGTDCFLNRIRSRLPGSVRAYVKVDEPFTYDAWIENLKQGRSFVTNGPMFEFSAHGKQLGETIDLREPQRITVLGKVSSQYPIGQAEVVFNGTTVATIKASKPGATSITIDRTIPITSSGWIALRARGQRHPDAGSGLFGHTSPIYLEVKGQPHASSEDASYFIDWIDRLWGEIRDRDRIPNRHVKHVEVQIMTARSVFEQLATEGK